MSYFRYFLTCVIIIACLWAIYVLFFMCLYFITGSGWNWFGIFGSLLPFGCAILCCGYVVYECVKKMLNDLRNKDKNGK